MKAIILVGLIAMAMAEQSNDLLKQSNDQFTAKMFNEVIKSNPGKSVIMSAFSVIPALAQLSLASVGESHNEILRAIGLPNDNVTKEVFKNVNSKLRDIKGVDLKFASRIYIAKDAVINANFAALSRDVFNSDVKNADFAHDGTNSAKEINTWVEEQTNNKIKDLVDPSSLDETTRAVLVNAIYFKGNWKNKFNAAKDGDFHVTKDKTVKIPIMQKKATYRYGESNELDAKLLELPYEGEESSLLIILPNDIEGLKQVQEKLRDPSALNEAVSKMYTSEVEVFIPKFKIETTTDLKDILQKIQVTKLFKINEAKLVNLLEKESNLYISEAIQKAFIEINEEGAEAAAANNFGVTYLSAFVPEKHEFVADHSFLFYLREAKNILFSGVYQL